MARTKEFDRDAALRSAMGVFWTRGYAATSTEALLAAMNIGRQSMYDTFGDKQRLFREALDLYNRERVAGIVARLRNAPTPLDGIAVELLVVRPEVGYITGASLTIDGGLSA